MDGKLYEADRQEMLDAARGTIASAMHTLGLPVDEGSEPGKFRTIGLLDISETVTNGTIAAFRFSVDNHPDFSKHPELLDPFALGLTSRFFLGVGEGLYRNREYILRKFEEMGANGERYFQALMSYLHYTERTKPGEKRAVPQYQHYPQTIAEARQYFVTG